jgi:hypothetical protein
MLQSNLSAPANATKSFSVVSQNRPPQVKQHQKQQQRLQAEVSSYRLAGHLQEWLLY